MTHYHCAFCSPQLNLRLQILVIESLPIQTDLKSQRLLQSYSMSTDAGNTFSTDPDGDEVTAIALLLLLSPDLGETFADPGYVEVTIVTAFIFKCSK